MELDITDFYNQAAPADYSASAFEIGQDAARITWSHACEDSADYMLLDTDDKREAFRDHVRGFGAWSEEEIAAWSDVELNALCIQMVSGDMREKEALCETWEEYEALSAAGTVVGRLFPAGNAVYYSID